MNREGAASRRTAPSGEGVPGRAFAPVLLPRLLSRLRSRRPEPRPSRLPAGDTQFDRLGGLEIHLKDLLGGGPASGVSGTALLLLHGLASGLFTWENAMPLLAADRRVVAYDRLAAGLSARPLPGEWDPAAWAEGSPYSPEAQADLAVRLLDRLGIPRAVVVGNSAGAVTAVLASLRHPERVAGLVLVNPTVDGRPACFRRLLRWAARTRLAPALAHVVAASARTLLSRARHPHNPPPDALVDAYRAQTEVDRWDTAMTPYLAAGQFPDLRSRLHEIDAPVLLVAGEADRAVPPRRTRSLTASFPQAGYVAIEETGHMPHEERPAAFAAALAPFLRRIDRRTANREET